MKSYQKFWLVLVTSLYCLHTVRNLSAIYAFVPPFLAMLGSFFIFVKEGGGGGEFKGLGVLVFFAFCFALPPIYSFFWYPHEDYLQSFFRYFYLVPFFVFALLAVDSFDALKIVLKTYAFFICACAFSIFYQIYFGPISWFAESSEREGLVRFSSLLGSLTSYGIFSVFALPIILFLFNNRLIQFFMFLVVVAGMLVTLQKAAVINIILFIICAFLCGNRAVKFGLLVSLFSGVVVVGLAYFFDFSYVVSTVDNVVRFRPGSGASDVSVYQSILDRMWGLPSILYELHGGLGMVLGVGMVGGSGTLGFIEYPMAHNGFFDLLFVGGVVNLVSFLLLWFVVFSRIRLLLRRKFELSYSAYSVSKACWCMHLIFIANFAFAGILYLQPYGGIIFYAVSVFFLLHYKRIRIA